MAKSVTCSYTTVVGKDCEWSDDEYSEHEKDIGQLYFGDRDVVLLELTV
jgi:hypothetical protein